MTAPDTQDDVRALLAKIVEGQGGTVAPEDSERDLLFKFADLIIP